MTIYIANILSQMSNQLTDIMKTFHDIFSLVINTIKTDVNSLPTFPQIYRLKFIFVTIVPVSQIQSSSNRGIPNKVAQEKSLTLSIYSGLHQAPKQTHKIQGGTQSPCTVYSILCMLQIYQDKILLSSDRQPKPFSSQHLIVLFHTEFRKPLCTGAMGFLFTTDQHPNV